MANAPYNPHAETARELFRPVVRLGPSGGAAPGPDDETELLKVLAVDRSAGGSQLDTISLEYDLGKTGESIVDVETQVEWNRKVEVAEFLGEDEVATPFAWGDTTSQRLTAGVPGGDVVEITASVQPYHFGDPLEGPKVYDPVDEEFEIIHTDVEFNPDIDGTVESNMGVYSGETPDYSVWIDPESVRTSNSQTIYTDITESDWTLKHIVNTLTKYLNADEDSINNPVDEDTSTLYDGSPAVKNLQIKRGEYLPALLDAVLIPYGFNWCIDYGVDASGNSIRTIRVFKRGTGTERELFLQRPGETYDPAETNLANFQIEYDVANIANEINVFGGFEERELTIELYRGWAEADDSLAIETLNKKDGSNYEAKPEVWRKWVANEAGDYSGDRTTTKPIPATALDLSNEFTNYAPKRRRFHRPLTFDADGRRQEPYIEYWNNDTSAWVPIKGTYRAKVSGDEMAVIFDEQNVPALIYQQGANAKVRITATVRGDYRLKTTATAGTNTPNADVVILNIDAGDRFNDRVIQSTGSYASTFDGNGNDSDAADDSAALTTYGESIRDNEESAEISAVFTVDGINREYQIGDLITKIDGRNINLNLKAGDSATKEYLQIFGIRYDFTEDSTTLTVQPAGIEGL